MPTNAKGRGTLERDEKTGARRREGGCTQAALGEGPLAEFEIPQGNAGLGSFGARIIEANARRDTSERVQLRYP
jgi:hypothetical protein